MGYYIEQIDNAYRADWEKAMQTIDSYITPMYDTFKAIIEENDFPSKAEERWVGMLDKIQSLSSDIKTETSNKFSEMMGKAEKFQGWFDALNALAGNNGFDWAKEKGFSTSENTTKEVAVPGPKAGNMDYNTYEHITTSTWKAFTSVSINADGYIDVTVSSFKKVKSSLTGEKSFDPSSTKYTVTNEETFQSVMNSK